MNIKSIQQKIYKVYSGNDYLPAWNFLQVLKTNDYRHLLKPNIFFKGDYERLPKIYFDLSKGWTDIYNEFLQKTNNQKWTVQLLITEQIERLRNELFIITRICIFLICYSESNKKEKYEKYLLDKGYKIDKINYEESIMRILKSTKGIEKKIELEKLKLKKPDDKQIKSIDDMLGELALKLEYYLPLKEISVNEFIGIKNALEKK